MHQIAANVAHFTMIADAIVIIYTNLHHTVPLHCQLSTQSTLNLLLS